ncbi:MAG: MarR family transcriptional regulator [Candidatus Peregrinibacteria bacterium]|nr:MarR family transcriptional regulator [Candidatus Peregrinibacteria bacterium]
MSINSALSDRDTTDSMDPAIVSVEDLAQMLASLGNQAALLSRKAKFSPQARAILALVAKRGTVTVKDLRDSLGMGGTEMSRTLNILEQDGFLTREINRRDKRQFDIGLTQKGVTALASDSSVLTKPFADALRELGLNPEECALLADSTSRVNKKCQDLLRTRAARKTPTPEAYTQE